MTTQKRVLIFTPGGVGGAERMSVLFGKMLPRDRYNVKFVVVGRLKTIYNLFPRDYEVDCIPVRNIYCFSTFRIWLKITQEKPDIVFVSQESYNGRVIIASKLAGCKVIVRSSSMIGKYKPSLLKQVRFTYPKADLIIAQQDEMRAEMLSLLKVAPDKIVTLYNPMDVSNIDIQSSALSPYSSDNSVKYVNVARVCYIKSHDVSIKAFCKVKTIIPNAKLFFVGNVDETSDYYKGLLRLLEELELKDSVQFVGYEVNPYKWIKHADCFILPSRVEGLPNALIEASYLGIPSVVTRCVGIVDSIIKNGQNGYVVDINDINGLSQAMIKAIDLKDCKMCFKPSREKDITALFDRVLMS